MVQVIRREVVKGIAERGSLLPGELQALLASHEWQREEISRLRTLHERLNNKVTNLSAKLRDQRDILSGGR